MGTYTLVDFKPINAHADFIIAHTAQPRVVLEESKMWCESVAVFLGQVKTATRPEDRKKVVGHGKLLVLAVTQICKLGTAILNVANVPAGTQQNLVKLCEDAKNYAKSIEWLLYPPIVEEKAPVEVDPFANIDQGYRTNRRQPDDDDIFSDVQLTNW